VRQALGMLSGLGLFAGIILFPQLRRMNAVPDLGDPLFSIWRMRWVYRQLLGDSRGLFDANIFHPEPLALTFSDSILLPSLLAAPLHAADIHPVAVYNIVLVATFILSGWAMYFLAWRLTRDRAAAFIAAVIFGFYPYRFEHYSHLELQMTMLMPLVLLALHRYAESHQWRWLGLSIVLAAAQFYSSMYYGMFLAMFGLVVSCCWILPESRKLGWRLAVHVVAAGALWLALIAPLAHVYWTSGTVRAGRDISEVATYSATPVDYLRAHVASAAWANVTPPGRKPERQLFPGLTILTLAVLGLTRLRDRIRVGLLAGAVFAFDASLGVNGFSYPLLYEWLPPMQSLRVPARFSILVGFSLALFAGFAIQWIRPRWSWLRPAVVAVGVIGIAVDVWPRLHLTPVWASPPPIYASLAGSGDRVVLAEFPAGGIPERFSPLPYMYFSVWHGHAMINGYSGYHPASYVEILEALEVFPARDTVEILRARGVTHVTVNCALFNMTGYGHRCDSTLAAAAQAAPLHEIVRVRWEGAPVVLFELR
jgi:hypothetical protein